MICRMSRTLNYLRNEYFMSNNRLRLRNTRAPLKQHGEMKRFTKSFLYRFTRRDGEEPAERRRNRSGLAQPSITLGKLVSCYVPAEWCSSWQNEWARFWARAHRKTYLDNRHVAFPTTHLWPRATCDIVSFRVTFLHVFTLPLLCASTYICSVKSRQIWICAWKRKAGRFVLEELGHWSYQYGTNLYIFQVEWMRK